MALAAASVFEVRSAGTDTNGGGFVTGAAGTDYSQQDAKNTVGADISTTDAVANGTTTITSATGNFGTTIVGNIIYLQGGTGSLAAGWYQVTARASTTSITVDRTVAAGTGITMNIGGALKSLGGAGVPTLVAGNKIYVKNDGAYSVTSASTNVAGGCLSKALAIYIEGYNSARGDMGSPPVFTASGINTFTFCTVNGSGAMVSNVSFDGASLTSSRGFLTRGIGYKLSAINCTNTAFAMSTDVIYERCYSSGGSGVAFDGGFCIDCVCTNNAGIGFSGLASSIYIRCISYANTGATGWGFRSATLGCIYINCVAYGNAKDGFNVLTQNNFLFVNCIAEGNTENGFEIVNIQAALVNCAGYNNTSGNTSLGTNVGVQNLGFVTGSATFFTNAGTGDFSLNNTAGGGAVARAAGYPGIFPGGLTTGYEDIGAAQVQATASAGGSYVF